MFNKKREERLTERPNLLINPLLLARTKHIPDALAHFVAILLTQDLNVALGKDAIHNALLGSFYHTLILYDLRFSRSACRRMLKVVLESFCLKRGFPQSQL